MSRLDRREVLFRLGGAALIPAVADRQLLTPWPVFKARYMVPDGRIVDTGNGGISHSEGQGYGMLLAQAAGDRQSFKRLWGWTAATLARAEDGLFSWRFDPSASVAVSDPNNATDGDLLIAWALLRAAAGWREPALDAAARRILAAVAARLVTETAIGPVLLPGLQGFRTAGVVTLNPSYWIWPALAAFAAVDAEGPWAAVGAAGGKLLDRAGFGPARLPTDWVDLDANGGVAPAAGRPPRFGFDALRVPLYLAWAGDRSRLAAFQAFWGPTLQHGKKPPAWVDVLTGELAPYAASAGASAVAGWICGKEVPTAEAVGDYYSDALAALTALARREAGFSPSVAM
jgi:endoglucanase